MSAATGAGAPGRRSEQELSAAMAAARRDRTTLAIAHRLSTVASADRVVVLDRGRVMDSGTPGALIPATTRTGRSSPRR